jgi:hypothetical protein
MTIQTRRLISAMLGALLMLAACSPAPATPTAAGPNVDMQVATSVAATLIALQSMTAAAQPSATATAEAQDPTATAMLPTATPFVIPTSTRAPGGGGGGNTTPTYACDVIRQRPFDNQVFRPGDKFDIKWTILNTGTATWVEGKDLSYFSGTKLTSAGTVELPQMKPRGQFSVVFDAKAPEKPGFYVMTWKLQGGFCYPYVAINVERAPDP